MSPKIYSVKIAGPAGTGIKSSGLLLSHILVKHGYRLRDYSEYPSLIRGGHNTYQLSFSRGEIFAPHQKIDLFFSLQPGHWQQHQPEFTKNTLIFSDGDTNLNLPLKKLSESLGGPIYVNTICLGVAAYMLNLDTKICHQIIINQFGKTSLNLNAFDLGYDYAKFNFSQFCLIHKPYLVNHKSSTMVYDGNEAFAWGFIKGGGNFYAAYPMTPSTGTLHFLASKQAEYNIQVIHPEDEISAASLSIGASYAGARSAVGTSGGGFALMTETVSFAGAANLGIVFYLVSRPGPATGLPTWTSQGDLLFAINAGHGEFNKIVLAPGDQEESFDLSATALNLAAKFNLPVIVLSDKFISESSASLPNLSLKKVKIVTSLSPIPGLAGKEYLANSYEHDQNGFSTEDPALVKNNADNRLKQKKQILKFVPKSKVAFGSPDSTILIVSWGSTKSVIYETLKIINNPRVAFLQITSLWPIDPKIKNIFSKFKKIIVIENNATSQLTTLLKSQFDFNPDHTILKYNGRPFFPEEIIKEINNLSL